jgi:hypothetical protein
MPIAHQEPVVVDSFSTLLAGDAFTFVSGKLPGVERYLHPLLVEQVVVAHLAVRRHLLQVLVFYFGVQLASQVLGSFPGRDADSAMGFKVHKGGRHLAPIAKFKRTLAQTATGDHPNGIGGAAVDFDEGNQAFAILASWLLDAQAVASEHCQTDTQHLPGAKMSVGNSGFFKKIIESRHGFQHALMLEHFRPYGIFTPGLYKATASAASETPALQAKYRDAAG